VFGAGTADSGEPYLAMEYVPGVDGYRMLRRLRLEGRSVPTHIALHIAHELLRALEAVHTACGPSGVPLGIIHRDVSPSNVYLHRSGAVKLGDFGIARSTSRSRRHVATDPNGGVKGKFAYLSPEQVAGEPADHRADLFSLGNVLSEMLLGQPLFPGGGQLQVLLSIRDCRIDALDKLKDVDPLIVGVLRRALSRDPSKRYASAAEFREALAPFQTDASLTRKELAVLVKATESATSTASFEAVRASVSAMRAMLPRLLHRSRLPSSTTRP
jgi:serine/threonine-protein kinase